MPNLIAIKKVKHLPFTAYRDGPCTAKAAATMGLPAAAVVIVPPIPPKHPVTLPPEWIARSQKRNVDN